MANKRRKNESSDRFYFLRLWNHCGWWLQPLNEISFLAPWKNSYDKLSILKSRAVTLLTKVPMVKAMIFSSSHVQMWELDHKVGWEVNNWHFWTVALEKTLQSPLDCKEIKPVNPKGNQPWLFIGRTDVEAEAPILWPLMQRTDSVEKTLMLGKIEGRRI